MSLIGANEVVGKSLYATMMPVKIYRLPSTSSEVVYSTPPHGHVGTVFSYIQKPDGLYWMFYDDNRRAYYTDHKPGKFNVSALRQQGVKTTLERVKEAEAKERIPMDPITKIAIIGTIGLLAILSIK